MVLKGQADLFEVVRAADYGRPPRHFLDGGQQQADQYGNDGDYHQQFDQRERGSLTTSQSTERRLHRVNPKR